MTSRDIDDSSENVLSELPKQAEALCTATNPPPCVT